MSQDTQQTKLLDIIYNSSSSEDWEDGVYLFKNDQVTMKKSFDTLLNLEVQDFDPKPLSINVKLHPSGNTIQWIECSCKKNRSQNLYCSHIISALIYLENSTQHLKNLDKNQPIKVNIPTKKSVATKIKSEKSSNDDKFAKQNIIQQLQGQITQLQLIDNGPKLKVFFEIKPGELKSYELELDGAAELLEEQEDLLSKSHQGKIKFNLQKAYICKTIIEKNNGQTLEIQKCIAIEENYGNNKKSNDFYIKTSNESKLEFKKFTVLQIDKNVFLGKKYIFVTGSGYYRIASNIQDMWHESASKRILKDDQVVYFMIEGLQNELRLGPLLTKSASLFKEEIVAKPKIQKLQFKSTKEGWLLLDPSYEAGKSKISLQQILNKLAGKKQKYIKTDDTWIEVPDYINEYEWNFDDKNQLKLDFLSAHRLRVTLGEYDHELGSQAALHDLLGKELKLVEENIPDLKDTKLRLRPYQQEGYQWLWWLKTNKLHGLLADDMGLGKTHQAMAILSAIQSKNKGKGNFLIVAPTTVLDHWIKKIEEFAPTLKPQLYYGNSRFDSLKESRNNTNTIITSYGIVLRDIKELLKTQWDAVILDEAHYIKNKDTATYQAASQLRTDFRLCLSGTPIENNLSELKNIFDFILPGFLGSDEYFNKHYIKLIQSEEQSDEENKLIQLLHPFKLRRTKSKVLKDLPEKVEDKHYCSLSPEQVKLYQETLDLRGRKIIDELTQEESKIDYIHIFAVLNLLKQICDHPCLLSNDSNYQKYESGKFELYKELLNQALGSNQKIVVYSQYLKMIDILSDHAKSLGVEHAVLTGSTRNRGQVIEEFQTNPNCKIYIGSLLAGGIGVDLTAASVVIHYDRWWNPSKENQATDRVHRIGQEKNVQVLKLITRGTLEEKIDQLIESKKSLYDRFLNKDEELFKSMTRSEVLGLLQQPQIF